LSDSLPASEIDNVGGLTFPAGVGPMPYLGASAPAGWYMLVEGGTTELIADYPRLFTVWGTRYGGDGVTTFGTPPADVYYRGASAAHPLWSFFGEDSHTLTAAEVPELTYRALNPPGGGGAVVGPAGVQESGAGHTDLAIVNVGGGAAHNNLPRSHAVNFIVKT
jgi:microcystin-dependent protein